MEDLGNCPSHPEWRSDEAKYGVRVVRTAHYAWTLVADATFKPGQAICPYSNLIVASEKDLDTGSDFIVELSDGRYCDGNLIGMFANDYPSQKDYINARWKVHSDDIVWLHVGSRVSVVKGDIIFVSFGYKYWATKIDVLHSVVCRDVVRAQIAKDIPWIEKKRKK